MLVEFPFFVAGINYFPGEISALRVFEPRYLLLIGDSIINSKNFLVGRNIEKLGLHLNSYKTYHEKLGKTIGTVVNHFNSTSKEFKKIDKDITKISGGKTAIRFDQENIEKPTLDNEE